MSSPANTASSDPRQVASLQIDHADIAATTFRLAHRLLLRADTSGHVQTTRSHFAELAGTSTADGARRHLTALAAAGIIHFSTNERVYVTFLAFPASDGMPSGRPDAPARENDAPTRRKEEVHAPDPALPHTEVARMRAETTRVSAKTARTRAPSARDQCQDAPPLRVRASEIGVVDQAKELVSDHQQQKQPHRTRATDDVFDHLCRTMEHEGLLVTPITAKRLNEWLDQVPASWVEQAIQRASETGVRTTAYIGGIIRNWHARGSVDAPRPPKETNYAASASVALAPTRPQQHAGTRRPWADYDSQPYDPAVQEDFDSPVPLHLSGQP